MNWINRGIFLCTYLVSLGFAQSTAGPAYLRQATISQTAQTVHITANSPRPLQQTLEALHLKYGWAVDYEDPQYVSQLDLLEAPASHSKVPSGGSFSVEFPAVPDECRTTNKENTQTNKPAETPAPPKTAQDLEECREEKTLRLVVDAYNHSKNPGQFELRRSQQGTFDVVGTGAHDEKGVITQQQPLFDVPVTLATEERTISATIDLIFQAIAQQNHSVVNLGISPRTILDHTTVKVGGTKVAARELLRQCFIASHHNLYWQLLFNPESKEYYLNVHAARQAPTS